MNSLGNVLITGGAGFVGSQLVKEIISYSDHVYVIDDLSTGSLSSLPNSSKLTVIVKPINDEKTLNEIIPQVDYIYHLACSNLTQSINDLDHDLNTNLLDGYLLLKKIVTLNPTIKRFIYTSTASVYSQAEKLPTPEDYYNITLPYAASKFAFEHYCQVFNHIYDIPTTILRLSNLYGPGQLTSNPYCGVVATFFECAMEGKPLPIYGDGYQTRDFTFIDDGIAALLLTTTTPKAIGKVYNVGTGIETDILTLANSIQEIVKVDSKHVVFKQERSIDVVIRRRINAEKISNDLKWKSQTPLLEGLYRTFLWLQDKEKQE
ncbi:UDP-glucose 4-epimerase [Oceanobacillus limi]|uniref:UDP-glucose 4-epimerase n=1 Tax=Oceanobacillus limi TaxID=930131 RepID=A0A1I0H0B6_9BACI|nr:NAD-dependent epimerase/dehydratase family protein [Oceanobacillus limi]SET76992.1 UDP-glucose 4-epimerase [Oceanobacillus limi]